jgi:hypothetical protein
MSLHYLAPSISVAVAILSSAYLIRRRSWGHSDRWLKFVAGIAAIMCNNERGKRALKVLKIISGGGPPAQE